MNRREVITGAGAAVAATVMCAAKSETVLEQTPKSHLGGFFGSQHEGKRTLTTVATVDDPDVEQILISVLVKKDSTQPLDSFTIERVLLKHVGTNLIPWFKYCRDGGMKTL